jgi:hypothetical protein
MITTASCEDPEKSAVCSPVHPRRRLGNMCIRFPIHKHFGAIGFSDGFPIRNVDDK